MSDDLISRKDFITETEINIGNIYNPDIIKGMKFAIDLINSRPTVFDKEKVIEELSNLKEDEKKYLNEFGDKDSLRGMQCYERAIEIVEKGGIG